ncbi:MAG: YidC/Oxa1 family membrane protein insertase [Patescibacteria group bacterium]
MSGLFNTVLYAPFFNLLVFLYNTVAFNDFGIAIILLTLIIRLLLSPLSVKTIKSQKALAELQPKIKEVQEKFKNDAQKQTQEVMGLYRRHKVNPFSGCFPLLIQLPILIALYRVSVAGFEENSLSVLYDFIKNPDFLNSTSLGFINLTKRNILLSVIAGAVQFWQTKMSSSFSKSSAAPRDQTANPLGAINHQMLYFFPIITIIISMSFPAGLPLYWITTTLFSIIEQAYINKIHGGPNGKFNSPDR